MATSTCCAVRRRFRHQFSAREKRIFLEHAFFVPDAYSFAKFLEREAKRELAAERIAIGANMAEHNELLMFAKDAADFFERRCYSLVLAVAFADVVQNFEHARTAFDRLVEMKNEMRRVFQHDVPGQLGLQRRRGTLPAYRLRCRHSRLREC